LSLAGALSPNLRVFAVFDDETIEVRDEMTAADINTWGSLSHTYLIFALEQEFKIVFTVGETVGRALGNVGELLARR